jgi:hypothetical protein
MNRIPGAITPEQHAEGQTKQRARTAQEKLARANKERDEWKLQALASKDAYDKLAAEYELVQSVDVGNAEAVEIEPTTAHNKNESCALSFLSDVHPFEVVKKQEVNGLNEYNPVIASASIKQFFQKTVLLTNIHRHATTINTLVLGCLGDLISNQLHDDQKETNAGTPQEEILFMMEHLEGGIDFLLEHGGYKKIVVVGCHGNHDRGTEYKQFAKQALHSHSWLLYKLLERVYRDTKKEKRVSFEISDGYLLYAPIYEKMWRFHHGDAIKYQGGIGGLAVPANRMIKGWNSAKAADYDVFGHWHHSLQGEAFFSVGSIMGYSAYGSEHGMPYEAPQQRFLLCDKKRGITGDHRIFVR